MNLNSLRWKKDKGSNKYKQSQSCLLWLSKRLNQMGIILVRKLLGTLGDHITSSPNSSLCGLALKNNCFPSLSLIDSAHSIRINVHSKLIFHTDFCYGMWLWFTYTIFLVHWMNSKLFFYVLQFKVWKV